MQQKALQKNTTLPTTPSLLSPTEPVKEDDYVLESELGGATFPRLARFTPAIIAKRRAVWNSCLFIVAIAFGFLQQSSVSWASLDAGNLQAWYTVALCACVSFGCSAAIISCEFNWRRELNFLRIGIAVQAFVHHTGITYGRHGTFHHVHYRYWVGDGTQDGVMQVTEAEYPMWTTGKRYLTVLYDVQKPGDSMPYSRVSSARLVAAPPI